MLLSEANLSSTSRQSFLQHRRGGGDHCCELSEMPVREFRGDQISWSVRSQTSPLEIVGRPVKVFEPAYIGTLRLRNRIIRSATVEGMSDEEGRPKRDLIDLYVRLAKGGVGAIITGVAGVQANGRVATNQAMLHTDEYVQAHSEVNAELQKYGTSVVLQIGHGGANTLFGAAGELAVAPSAYKWPLNLQRARALTDEEIRGLVQSFVQTIMRAKKAGYGAVQLHAAHGYLLCEFLSPRMNRRVDRWGGPPKTGSR
jgi:2,4-dienoyl-CoA reductase-like NADH-dependent reductase (Old Yellow Enzyme family)